MIRVSLFQQTNRAMNRATLNIQITGLIGHIYIDGLVQDCSNSSALPMELLQFSTEPSI